MELSKQEIADLIRILDNALDNPELFITLDENDYEIFDNQFHQNVKKIKNALKNKGEGNGNN